MDLTKVNPILGYEMYTQRDRAKMAQRSAYGIDMPLKRAKREIVLPLKNQEDE